MKKEPVRTCSGIPQLVAEEAGLDYDPVKLHGWDSRVDLQRGSHRASLLHVSLKALGITSHTNLGEIRKVVAKRTFEPHYLMLRSYYAVKFSSSSQVDFSRLVGSSARSLFSTASGFSHNLFGGT
jgi:hypothetical protein